MTAATLIGKSVASRFDQSVESETESHTTEVGTVTLNTDAELLQGQKRHSIAGAIMRPQPSHSAAEVDAVKELYPGASNADARMILETRAHVSGKVDVNHTLSPREQADTLAFVRDIASQWDSNVMRGGDMWKTRVADVVSKAFDAGVGIMGVAEWDESLNQLVEARGLGVSSSPRTSNGEDYDGNSVIYDKERFELVSESKHVFSNRSLKAEEKIWHEAVLRDRSSGKQILVQSAHLEKIPSSTKNNGIRVLQVREMGQRARKLAKQKDMSVILLADSNSDLSDPANPGQTNPVQGWLETLYSDVYRAPADTSITAQRSVNIDLAAAIMNDSLKPGSADATNKKLGKLAATQGQDPMPLPNPDNPSDHKLMTTGFEFEGKPLVTAAWNALDGRYRNPLKGNLLYPMAFGLDDSIGGDAKARKDILTAWGAFYETARTVPALQGEGTAEESMFLEEYLVGAGLETMNDLRATIEEMISDWSDADRQAFEADRQSQPELFASTDAYAYTGEATWIVLHRRTELIGRRRNKG